MTVVNSGEHLLGTMDSELSDLLRRAFEKQGMRIVLGRSTRRPVNGELNHFENRRNAAAGHGAVCDRPLG